MPISPVFVPWDELLGLITCEMLLGTAGPGKGIEAGVTVGEEERAMAGQELESAAKLDVRSKKTSTNIRMYLSVWGLNK